MLDYLMPSQSVVMDKVKFTFPFSIIPNLIPCAGNVIGLMLTPSIQSTYSLCDDITVRTTHSICHNSFHFQCLLITRGPSHIISTHRWSSTMVLQPLCKLIKRLCVTWLSHDHWSGPTLRATFVRSSSKRKRRKRAKTTEAFCRNT